MNRTLAIRGLTALSGLVFAVLGLAGCGGESAPAEPVIRPVRWVEVVATGSPRERSYAGEARAETESQLSFRVGGTVQSVSVVVGDTVSTGREIARLDPTDYRLQVQEIEASLAQAKAAERKATADYERVRGLYENNNASKSDLDAARAQSESTQAQVEATDQRLQRVARQVAYTRLTAPVDGAIASVLVEVNENVAAGQTVALLTSGSRPQVESAIPGALISSLREGDLTQVHFDDLPGTSFTGVVTEVGVVANRTGAFPVTVRLDKADGAIRSGMAATVTFRFAGEGKDRTYVPAVAVGEDAAGRFVYVLERVDDSEIYHARRREVAVGDLTPDGLEVTSGLEDGERVVTAGVRRIQDGQQVRLLDQGA